MLLFILALSLLATLGMGFYIVLSAPHISTHRAFALFLGTMTFWIVKDIMLWGLHGPNDPASWWAILSFLISLALNVSFLYFAWIFPEETKVPPRKTLIATAPALVLIPLILTGKLWEDVGFHNGTFEIKLTPYAYLFGIYVHTLLALGIARMITKYRRYRHHIWGKQILLILIGVVVTGALTTLGNVILPLARVYALLPYGSVFILMGVFFYAYAMTNFRLFSIQSALDHLRLVPITSKVTVTVFAVAVAGFVCLQLPITFWSFGLSDLTQWKQYFMFSAITAPIPCLALIALIMNILSRPLRKITEAAVEVTQGNYGARVDVISNDEIGVLAESFNTMSQKLERDILDLKKMGERLLQTEKLAMAGVLTAGVAHELNNPLASISSLVQIMMERERTPETLEKLKIIFAQINRISNILRDMMEFARPKAPQRVLTGINQIIQNSLRLVRFDKRFQAIRVETDLDPKAPALLLDPAQLEQVFLNLYLNARDAMADGGRLSISSRLDTASQSVIVEVQDSGEGIRADQLHHIFDPFFTTKAPGAGTGLGLSVCHSIIHTHGGQITAESRAGRGTCVRLSFPLTADQNREPAAN